MAHRFPQGGLGHSRSLALAGIPVGSTGQSHPGEQMQPGQAMLEVLERPER